MLGALRVGDEITVDDRQLAVVAISGSEATVCDSNGAQECWRLSRLFASLDRRVPVAALREARVVDDSPSPAFARARLLEGHILEATSGLPRDGQMPDPRFDVSRTTQAERDMAKLEELRGREMDMSLRTWQRLKARYRSEGVVGLVDARARRRSRSGVDPRVVAAVCEVIDARADDSTRTKQWVIDQVGRLVSAWHGVDAPALPSRAAMYRLLEECSTGTGAFGEAPTRRSLAMAPAGPFGRTHAYRPGERVEIDSTRADFLVLTGDGRSVRPELTVAVDTATRSILAASLEYDTASADLSVLLAEMVAPRRLHADGESDIAKRHLLVPDELRFADVEERVAAHSQQPLIMPETLVADLGPAFRSAHFRRSCERLGISLEQARARTPTDKPTVESTIGAINLQFCQQLPGYVGRSAAHRGRNIEGTLTIEQAQDLLEEWTAVHWQRRPHAGLRSQWGANLSPNALANHFYSFAGEVPLPLSACDYIELLPFKWVAVHRYGVNFDRRVYDSSGLNPFRLRRNPDLASGGKWALHYNPKDVFEAFLRGPDGWINVEWVNRALFSQPFGSRLWALAKKQSPGRSDEEIARTAARIQMGSATVSSTGPDTGHCKLDPGSNSREIESSPCDPMEPFDPSVWP